MFNPIRYCRDRLDGFDRFVIAGGIMNLLVIVVLIGYWLLH